MASIIEEEDFSINDAGKEGRSSRNDQRGGSGNARPASALQHSRSLRDKNFQYMHPSFKSSDIDPDADLLENNDELDSLMNPIIFHRGVRSQHFYLVLTGKVGICSGNEGFIMEKGPFNYIGMECLVDPDYVPDFSSKIMGKTTLLRISRDDYLKAIGDKSMSRKTSHKDQR